MDNIIALRPKQYQLIEIQTTLVLGNDKTYLNTVNIMFDNIIIEKIFKYVFGCHRESFS